MTVENLKTVASTPEFIKACQEIVSQSPDVSIDQDKVSLVEGVIGQPEPEGYLGLLSEADLPPCDAALELAVNAAFQGGFWYREHGQERKWEIQGSSADANNAWLNTLWEYGLLPGVQLKVGMGEEADLERVCAQIEPFLEGIPYADWRMKVCQEFSSVANIARLALVVSMCQRGDGWKFSLITARALQNSFPEGFGGDPFMKKVLLVLTFLAGHLSYRGFDVHYDLPVPSDYQGPRMMNWIGAIRFSDRLKAALQDRVFFHVESPEVVAMRAAAVVVAHMVSLRSGIPSYLVDSGLYMGVRVDPAFRASSLPAMRVETTWY